MSKIQNAILKKIAGIGKSAAVKAAGAASWGGCHQPKEPKALQNLEEVKQSNFRFHIEVIILLL